MVEERNRGIDLLRIISMLMIVTLHTLGHGGILDATERFSVNYGIAWFLETMVTCAVNCYALISGYVGIRARFQYSNIVYLWFQVMLYSVLGSVIGYFCLHGEFLKKRDLFMAFFPVTYGKYWYFKAYFAMFFFIPFLNFIIHNLRREQARNLIAVIVMLFSVFPTIAGKDLFGTGNGYSALWLAALYLIGGYISKYRVRIFNKRSHLWKAYAACVLFTWGWKLLLDYVKIRLELEILTERIQIYYDGMTFLQYTSPTMLAASVVLLLWFANIGDMNQIVKRLVVFAAPAAFGVYLIHDNSLIRESLMINAFAGLGECVPPVMTGGIVLAVFGIFLLCLFIDRIRLWLFTKLKVKQRSEMLVRFWCQAWEILFPKTKEQ